MELLADRDEEVGDAYLEGETLSAASLRAGVRRAVLSTLSDPSQGEAPIVPLLCGSALQNLGVQPLLDAAIEFLPSPIDMPPARARPLDATDGEGDPAAAAAEAAESTHFPADHEGPLCALAFKIVEDRQRGALVYTRIYSGTVKPRDKLFNSCVASSACDESLPIVRPDRQ